MRTFVTKCVVGDIVTEGEGNGKKVSIKDEGELMLAMIVMIVVIMILSQNMLFMTLSLEMMDFVCDFFSMIWFHTIIFKTNKHKTHLFIAKTNRFICHLVICYLQVSKKKAAELMLDQLRQVGAMVVSIPFYFFILFFTILNS